jgi:hypothetical protein
LVEGNVADLDLVVELAPARITQVVHFAAYKKSASRGSAVRWLNGTGTVKLVSDAETGVNEWFPRVLGLRQPPRYGDETQPSRASTPNEGDD